ncbi:MAG: undecaprenyl/decaprenyl-phosphate alpha-N-acetylglucosaminyl 1-phosphate transferase [Alistipes sp.]|nr:undecaprenyl/decaprenyl-phosphate alpha-N-acetylglucosaminyl 1-phosphate transferase [Alistipes sp.]
MNLLGVIAAFIASFVVVAAVHSRVIKWAVRYNVVDNPNHRKLQREPVPVLGGVAVFFGLVVGLCVASPFMDIKPLLPVVMAMSVMLCVGVVDDASGLSPWFRFLIEIAVTLLLILLANMSLNNFQGLWGVYGVPMWLSIPLTIVAVVGIINAINLIDGVDGLSSGYCIMASLAFGTLFFKVDSVAAMLLCAISISSLLPFFFHNVFGKKSKMFIGDGGSLMMGVVMSSFVVASISSGGACDKCVDMGIGLVPFTLAVMCVPVFDTVRVMFMRILRHTSPFHPDKTHLHHLFIEMGFSHFGTTMCVLSLNALVVLCWYISYRLGASVDTQFYVVVSIGVLLTAGFYKFMRIQIARESAILRWMRGFGAKTHVDDKKWWGALQRTVDLK